MKILIAVIPLLAGFLLDCLATHTRFLTLSGLSDDLFPASKNGSDADSPHGLFWAAWL